MMVWQRKWSRWCESYGDGGTVCDRVMAVVLIFKVIAVAGLWACCAERQKFGRKLYLCYLLISQ